MKVMKKKRNLILVFLLILTVSIGYAYISTNLKIDGTSQVKSARWNIYWSNPVVTTGSVTNTLPTLTESNTIATYTVTLDEPGDFYEFTIDATNAGSIDAMIAEDGISNRILAVDGETTTILPSYVGYSVTYLDGGEIAPKHVLSAQEGNTPTTETYKVKVWYKQDIGISDINNAESDVTLKFRFDVRYVQADKTAVETGIQAIKKKAITLEDVSTRVSAHTPIVEPVIIPRGATAQTPSRNEYRYMGANPNNYIYFNCSDYSNQSASTCQKWRIIGIVDDKIKIVQIDLNDIFVYDSATTNWPDTSLFNHINSNISDLHKNYLDNATWYLGIIPNNGYTPEQSYQYERGNTRLTENHDLNVKAYMGLMYPSDYGYASSECYTHALGQFNSCTSSNWLTPGRDEWLLGGSQNGSIFVIRKGGDVRLFGLSSSVYYRKAAYLKSNVQLYGGDGTNGSPYKIRR